jgi:hypothetical protein
VTNRGSEEEIESCVDCGAATDVGRDRGYVAGEQVLCWTCAIKRGGNYDADQDRWTVPPRTDDLWDDEYRAR